LECVSVLVEISEQRTLLRVCCVVSMHCLLFFIWFYHCFWKLRTTVVYFRYYRTMHTAVLPKRNWIQCHFCSNGDNVIYIQTTVYIDLTYLYRLERKLDCTFKTSIHSCSCTQFQLRSCVRWILCHNGRIVSLGDCNTITHVSRDCSCLLKYRIKLFVFLYRLKWARFSK
jgi:hypothetical protein